MVQVGDSFLFHPFLAEGYDESADPFSSVSILQSLRETDSFFIITLCSSFENNEPIFVTELRPMPIKDGKVTDSDHSVQFIHTNSKVMEVTINNNFSFNDVIELFDKAHQNKILYTMDILQSICKET